MFTVNCITCTIVSLIIIFAIVVIPTIVYYSQHPKDPTFTLKHASIHGFNLTSDGHLNSFFNLVITANNPNHRMKLDYSGVRVSIYKDEQKLAEDVLDDFDQRKRSVTLLRAEAMALNVLLNDDPRFDLGLESGMGYIDFDVFVTANLNGENLEVNCDNVIVNVTTNVRSNSSSKNVRNDFRSLKCGVHIYSNDEC